MIRFLIVLGVIITAIIVGISLYLQPNDLAGCTDTPTTSGACKSVDAIIAVSGGDTNARTDEAIRLYKAGWAPLLIFAGAAEDKTGPSNAAAMKTRALKAGVSEVAISIEEASETTRENAQNSQMIFAEKGIRSVILVTSGYHQRRATLEFHKQAPDMTIVNHPVASDQDWSMWWWTAPRGWTLATGELIRIVMFHAGVEA
jgi:uncharacterized SAM-binding protein YcdF (DUF218 family)